MQAESGTLVYRAAHCELIPRPSPAAWSFIIIATFALSAVVHIEPAPFDIICIGLLAVMVWRVQEFPVNGLLFPLVFLALFCLTNIVSAMISIDQQVMRTFLATTLYLVCVFFLIILVVVEWLNGADLILNGFMLSAVLSSALSVLSLFNVIPLSELLVFGDLRVKGFFKDPNVFGPFVVIAILFLLLVLERGSRSILARVSVFFSVAILVSANALAGSRAAWLNLMISFLIYVCLRAWQLRRQPAALGRIAVLLICLGITGTGSVALVDIGQLGSFLSERAQLQTYDEDRFGAQAMGVSQVLQRPVGIGPGQFEAEVGSGTRETSAHSLYVRILVENGALGLVSFLLFLAASVGRGLGLALRPWGRQDVAAVCVASLIGTIVNSAVIDTVHWRHFWVQLGLIWGLHALRLREFAAGRGTLGQAAAERIRGSSFLVAGRARLPSGDRREDKGAARRDRDGQVVRSMRPSLDFSSKAVGETSVVRPSSWHRLLLSVGFIPLPRFMPSAMLGMAASALLVALVLVMQQWPFGAKQISLRENLSEQVQGRTQPTNGSESFQDPEANARSTNIATPSATSPLGTLSAESGPQELENAQHVASRPWPAAELTRALGSGQQAPQSAQDLALASQPLGKKRAQERRALGSPEPVPTPAPASAKDVFEPSVTYPSKQASGAAGSHPALAGSIARGDGLVAQGDYAAARLLYLFAANRGSAEAAIKLARTYDPEFLNGPRVRFVRPRTEEAIRYYQLAQQLGDRSSASRLEMLLEQAATR